MVAAFPLAKIGLLFLKQLSKPVANLIKNEAKKHPLVRRFVIIPTGKAYGWIENYALFSVKGGSPGRLTEEEYVELGSNAIGEIILFSFLSIILLAEISRQGDKKAVIQKTKEEEISNIVDTVLGVIDDVEALKISVNQIQTDLEKAMDVFDFEEKLHSPVEDNNFLDILSTKKKFFKRNKKKEEAWDSTSPSI